MNKMLDTFMIGLTIMIIGMIFYTVYEPMHEKKVDPQGYEKSLKKSRQILSEHHKKADGNSEDAQTVTIKDYDIDNNYVYKGNQSTNVDITLDNDKTYHLSGVEYSDDLYVGESINYDANQETAQEALTDYFGGEYGD